MSSRIKMFEQTKITILFILPLLTSYLCQDQLKSDCKTPNGDLGTCLSIMDCQPLLNLVQKNDRTPEELQMLRRSQCGISGKIVKVCCEINDTRCYNPDGNLGLCVTVSTCPAITKLLQPPISTENFNFMKNSRCENSVQSSVCCGPDHMTNVTPLPTCEPSSAPPDPRTECCGLETSNGNKILDFIRPICLPTSDITQSMQNLVLRAAGWGAVSVTEIYSDIKLHVDLPYKPLELCQAAYNVSTRKLRLWSGQICAGGEPGKDTCKGDSGGPLMYDNGRIFSVVGVVSFGPKPCALKDVPGVYTKVYEYIPWIRSKIKP